MQSQSIVNVHGRLWIALNVTRSDIAKGMNARKPGLHLFAGYWYGTNHRDHASYGKVIEVPDCAKVVGYARTSHHWRKHLS